MSLDFWLPIIVITNLINALNIYNLLRLRRTVKIQQDTIRIQNETIEQSTVLLNNANEYIEALQGIRKGY